MALAKRPAKPRAKSASPRKSAMPGPAAQTSETAASQTAPSASTYAVGDQITHPMFGDGAVTAIDGTKLTIEFAGSVVKQIIDYYVKPRKP